MQTVKNNPKNNNKHSIFIEFYSFYKKEVDRFLKVWGQTILSPVITSSMMFFVFYHALGSRVATTDNPTNFLNFLLPGIIMMSIIQNSFANTSSTLLVSKLMGTITDILISPLTPMQLVWGYFLSGITRGFLVAFATIAIMLPFTEITIHSFLIIFYFGIISSGILSSLGLIAGIVSTKFDQLANFTTLIITPLTFLSGTFYSINSLPIFFQKISHYNPVFFMIDGFRYGFNGVNDFSVISEGIYLFAINFILLLISYILLKTGYKLRN
jgi:ABC-2 type transport system permease protein